MAVTETPSGRPRVIVVGGGFAGLQAVRRLRGVPVDVTLVDRRNFHLFQPLAYQVATGALSPAEIAAPLRGVLKRQRNARVVLAEVDGFDLERRLVSVRTVAGEHRELQYDLLAVAGGSRYSYFGHEEWRPVRPGAEVARGGARDPAADPGGVRGRRARAGPRGEGGLADLRGGRRRPHRGRDGRADRRAGARHAAARLPGDRHPGRPRAPGRGRRPGAARLRSVALRRRRGGARRGSA